MKLILLLALIVGALSVMYSLDSNFKVSLQRSPLETAHCYYVDKSKTDGWSQFYVYASSGYDLITQYRAAGFLQGYSSYKEIYYAYTNFYNSILKGQPNVDIKVKDFVDQQLDWIDHMYQQNSRDQYWQQAYALVEQVRYMYKGFIQRVNQQKANGFTIGFSQFYYLTNTGDLEDLIPAFSSSSFKNPQNKGECDAFIKIIKNKLHVTQSTYNIYEFMLRFHKIYDFPTTRTFQPAAETITLTSRPGDLESKDDFYLLSSGLAVVETSLGNFNKDNYKLLNPKSVPTWIRHLVANRLAHNPSQWANIFLKFRSYTHNNQWIVVDIGRFNRVNKTQVLMVEEGFGESAVTNFTSRLYQTGFVASYNVPYNEKVYKALKYEEYGFTYENDPRALQFADINGRITSYDLLKHYLTTNNHSDPCDGIAPRCDLKEDGPFLFGMVDQKIATSDYLESNKFQAISGPPTNQGKWKVFNWSDWPGVSHVGMPQVMNFTWINLPFDYEGQNITRIESNLNLLDQ